MRVDMANLTGQIIKGYALHEELGVGGYGAVYRAIQPAVAREVAVKVILPQYANHPDFIRRFEAEAQLVARLEHPHIVPLYDYWREPDSAYLVMRFLRGGSLHERLLGEPWAPQSIVPLLDQIAAALTTAHRHGVVHRDLKPANVLLDEDGNAYLADFGIAKDLGSAFQTDHSGVIGSPAYISPEQIRAETISPRTDIYSLGIMLYEILVGELPFEGPTPIVVFFKHIHEQLPRLQRRRPELSDALNAVLQRATAKNPEERYPDVMSLVADFRQAVGGASLARSFGGIGSAPSPDTASSGPGNGNGQGNGHRTTGKRRTGSIYDTGVLYHTALLDAVVPAVENPYKGLRAFQEADAGDFFGREALTRRLLGRLGEAGELARFLAVIGPSGSGKSSVVRAGVLPALRRGTLTGSRHWFIVEMIPGAQPLAELAQALLRVAVDKPRDLLGQLQRDERGLLHATQQLLPGGAETELVLVLDQFEEVFTLVEDEAERTHFLNSLQTAVTDPHSRLRVILTLRADFYDRPLLYTGLSELVRERTEVVTPLTAEELQHAIVGPAERVGVSLEADLVGALVAEVSEQPGTLPLLQYALTELFERRSGRVMTLDAYTGSGGVTGALARRADLIYQRLQPSEQAAARQLFLRLVTLGEGAEDTRRRVLRSELTALSNEERGTRNDDGTGHRSAFVAYRWLDMETVIDTYDKYRLLTGDRDPITRTPTVEVAHEALIRTWGRLRDWLDASRDDLRLQRRLAVAAAEWAHAGRDPSYLAGGVRLEQFSDWSGQTQLALNADERVYLEASLAERDREQAAELVRKEREVALERRSRSVLRALVGVFVVATVVGLGLAALAFSQRQAATRSAAAAQQAELTAQSNADAAERARQEAQTNADTAKAAQQEAQRNADEAQNVALYAGAQEALSKGNTDQAVALALIANQTKQPLERSQLALAEAAYTPGTRHIFIGHTGGVNSVAFSPDGKTFVSGSDDKSVILWDVATGEKIRTFAEGHTKVIRSVAFNPDGKTVLSGSEDGTMILWDVATGRQLRTFNGHAKDAEVKGVAISPDGKRALSASSDTTIILWDLGTGAKIHTFTGHTQEVDHVAFSKDGTKLLSSSQDTSVILWDIATGQPIQHFEGHTDEVRDAEFSPDGKTIISSDESKNIFLWDVATGQRLESFIGHTRSVYTVAFSPDGKTVLSGSKDNQVILWDIKTARPIRSFRGHANEVHSVAFSPDGTQALTSARDNMIRLWDLQNGAEMHRFEGQHTDTVDAVAYSPDNKLVVSASADNTLALWDAATGQFIRRLGGHSKSVFAVAFSPDNKSLLSGADDFTLILWDVATGQVKKVFNGHKEKVQSVVFSPDGKTALSGAGDFTLILWDVASGQPIRTFKGHEDDVTSVALTADGALALSGGVDGKIFLWDVASGKSIREFESTSARVQSVAFSPDGKLAISGSDNLLILWDVGTGKAIRSFVGHTAEVQSVAFSPDGKLAISGSADNFALIWDVATGQAIRRFTGTNAVVRTVAFSPDGKSVLTGGNDKVMHMWRIDSLDALLTWTKANRYIAELTCDQADLYHVEQPCTEAGGAAAP
jgi:WD40 repeat protein